LAAEFRDVLREVGKCIDFTVQFCQRDSNETFNGVIQLFLDFFSGFNCINFRMQFCSKVSQRKLAKDQLVGEFAGCCGRIWLLRCVVKSGSFIFFL
jgi:hypothetical protein